MIAFAVPVLVTVHREVSKSSPGAALQHSRRYFGRSACMLYIRMVVVVDLPDLTTRICNGTCQSYVTLL